MKYPVQTLPKEGSGTLADPAPTDGPLETPQIHEAPKDVPIKEVVPKKEIPHVADLSSPVRKIREFTEVGQIGRSNFDSNIDSCSSTSIGRDRMREPEEADRYGDDTSLSQFLDGCEDRPQTLGDAGTHCVGYHKGWNRGRNRALKTKKRDEVATAAAIPAKRSIEAVKVKVFSTPDSRTPGGRLSSITEMSKLLATIVRLRVRTLAFCGVRKLVELVLKYCLQDLNSSTSSLHLAELVASYRGE